MENFRDLVVWQRALKLAVAVSKATLKLPWYERYDLGSQMRRSARSVHASIAEGCGRRAAGRSEADSLRLFGYASAELHELDSDVEYSREAGYWPASLANPMLEEIQAVRMKLASLMAYRRSRRPPQRNDPPSAPRRRARPAIHQRANPVSPVAQSPRNPVPRPPDPPA